MVIILQLLKYDILMAVFINHNKVFQVFGIDNKVENYTYQFH